MKMLPLKKKQKPERLNYQNLQWNYKIGRTNKKLNIFKNMKLLILKHISVGIKTI